MKKLLLHYEIELALLRRYSRGFAERYPGLAGSLQMTDETCKDPHVERMLQGTALLAARVSKRLDDDYPKFTESLLEMLYPHYLRAFPSSSIVLLDFRKAAVLPDAVDIIPRGTIMKAPSVRGVKCQFRTTSDIVVAPIKIAAARFHARVQAQSEFRLPLDVGCSISVTIETAGKSVLNQLNLKHLKLFINGEPALCAAVRDAIFARTKAAYVSYDNIPLCHPLQHVPLIAAGFDEDEALLPFSARSHPAYRLLTEYFAFPEKFNFVDLAWTDIAGLMPQHCRSFTLHLALQETHEDAHVVRALHKFTEQNLLLHCAPVVNLFSRVAAPVEVSHTAPDYELLADTANPAGYEIYGIESASLITDVADPNGIEEVQPYYSLRHGQPMEKPCRYWIMRRDDVIAELSPGHETRITLVDSEDTPIAARRQTLSVKLVCSNRDLPTVLRHGTPDGDLTLDALRYQAPLRLLRKPSPPFRFESGNGAHWRLISHLTLNHRDLTHVGLDELRQMLTLYNLPRSAASHRQIQGVVGLEYKVIMAWITGTPTAALMPGIEIRMTLDEEAFVGSSVHLFIQVLDYFFGLHGQINVFTQLIAVSSQTGEELMQCPRRSGAALLA